MALSQPALTQMSETEYLEFERASERRHEYYNGEIFAMTGASEAHNLITGNLMFILKRQMRGRSCKVYPADMRVRIEATGLYTYPDLSVVCGEAQFSDEALDSLLNPTVIIEVLSPSTEAYDRGKKFQHYRRIMSLQEYVLIAQDNPHVERYLRQENDIWQFSDAKGLDARLELASIDCVLDLTEVYEQVTFGDASATQSLDAI